MPVRKVQGGYQWDKTGKVYPARAQAERQGRGFLHPWHYNATHA